MHQIMYHLKKFQVGACPRTPLALPRATLRHATRPNSKKVAPPLANPAYADG